MSDIFTNLLNKNCLSQIIHLTHVLNKSNTKSSKKYYF